MKKKKKLRLKKRPIKVLIALIIIITLGIFGFRIYKDYQYKQTDEYHLLQLGYVEDEVNIILQKGFKSTIQYILNTEKNPLIPKLMQEKYYLNKNLEKYLEYYEEEEDEELSDIIALVNTHANNKWYEEEYDTDTTKNELVLINKFYALKSDYTPSNMQTISLDYSYGEEGENSLINYAYDEFMNLWQNANKAGFYLMVTSSYRDYKGQEEIYNDIKNGQGQRKADEVAARPGHSEHQTGLVVDMTSKNEPTAEEFSDSKAYNWLKENAYLYGFIERYPKDKTYITGYSPESWHWRYVGKQAAKIIHEEQITFDEYYAYYIEKDSE